jgi:hypothetical protein
MWYFDGCRERPKVGATLRELVTCHEWRAQYWGKRRERRWGGVKCEEMLPGGKRGRPKWGQVQLLWGA